MSSKNSAVIILNWNGKPFLQQFLPSVIKFSAEAAIYVADNQSTDDSVDFIKSNFPQVNLIINPINEGFAKGYNSALKQVKEEYYILLNSDVEVTENWITPIISLMAANANIAACQPKLLDFKNKQLFEYAGAAGGYIDKYGYPFCRGRFFNVLEEDTKQYDNSTKVFWASGACMFVRAEAFWKVGGFDERYFAHMEEIDLCWRMQNIGYDIFCEPKSTVYHVGGGTLNKLSPQKTYLNFRNNLMTLTKNSPPEFLFFKLIFRQLLDGVAAFKFLLEGNGLHFLAVIKAHFSFYFNLSSTLKKRRMMKKIEGFRYNQSSIFKVNIVYLHFIKSLNYYSELIKKIPKI